VIPVGSRYLPHICQRFTPPNGPARLRGRDAGSGAAGLGAVEQIRCQEEATGAPRKYRGA